MKAEKNSNMPRFDDNVMDLYRQNLNLMTNINKMYMEVFQQVFQANAQYARELFNDAKEVFSHATSNSDPQVKLAKGNEFLKSSIEKTAKHTNKLGEQLKATQENIFSKFNEHFQENIRHAAPSWPDFNVKQ